MALAAAVLFAGSLTTHPKLTAETLRTAVDSQRQDRPNESGRPRGEQGRPDQLGRRGAGRSGFPGRRFRCLGERRTKTGSGEVAYYSCQLHCFAAPSSGSQWPRLQGVIQTARPEREEIMGLTGTNILPGLSVTVAGEAEGIRFLMTNITDETIIVDLTVTGPNFPKDQENTAYHIYVPPARGRNPRASAYNIYAPPNSFPDHPRPVFYWWELPPGVYNASVRPRSGPSSEVGTGLVVTAPIRSVSGGNVAFPSGHHVIVSDHLAS